MAKVPTIKAKLPPQNSNYFMTLKLKLIESEMVRNRLIVSHNFDYFIQSEYFSLGCGAWMIISRIHFWLPCACPRDFRFYFFYFLHIFIESIFNFFIK